jgi:transposase
MRVKRAALTEALTGQFDDHHAELARILLDQIDTLTGQIDHLTLLIDQMIAAIPNAQTPVTQDSQDGDGSPTPQDPAVLAAIDRLDEVPGIGIKAAQIILAEIGLDMSVFPTAGHLVSWARLCPRTLQSGATNRAGRTGKGNPYLKGVLGEVAAAAAKTHTFLGERYRRLVKRRGKLKALVAVARSILVIIWHLLAGPTARFHDLGTDYYTNRIDKNRKTRNLVHQLQALGHQVALNPAA